jgi:non-ribosomal peptide synthetase component E (peptide arylation enzyme)
VSGEAAAERAVMSALAERLDVARLPDECHVIDAFPLTANGKVDRRALAGMLR